MVMVTLTISSASKPPAFARGFPLLIEAPEDATVADVKASIAAKYPKVSCVLDFTLQYVHYAFKSIIDALNA